MTDPKEEAREFALKVAEMERDDLTNLDFRPKFVWHVEGHGARLFMFPELGHEHRDKLAFALKVLSSTMDANQLTLVVDSYVAKTMTKKDGTRWGPNEMEQAAVFQTENADLVTECLTIHRADAGGWGTIVSVPYERTPTGVDFKWDVATVLQEGNNATEYASGDFPEMMREAMVQPKIYEIMEESLPGVGEALGLTQEERRMHTLCAGVKHVMASVGFPCAIAATSEVEAGILKRSFEGTGAEFIADENDTDENDK